MLYRSHLVSSTVNSSNECLPFQSILENTRSKVNYAMKATIGMTTFGHSENLILIMNGNWDIFFLYVPRWYSTSKKPNGCTYQKHSFFSPNTSISVSGRSSPPPPQTTLIKKIFVRSLYGEMFVCSGDRRSIHFTKVLPVASFLV